MRNTQYGCAREVQRAREKRIELAGSESLATGKCAGFEPSELAELAGDVFDQG